MYAIRCQRTLHIGTTMKSDSCNPIGARYTADQLINYQYIVISKGGSDTAA